MSKHTPWLLEDALSNVHQSYHPTIEWVYHEILQEGESVFLAAEASRPVEDRRGNLVKDTTHPCLIVITSYRWLRASFHPGPAFNKFITYHRHVIKLGSWPRKDETFAHQWVTPPKSPPKNKTQKYENIADAFIELPLQSMADVKRKTAFAQVHKGEMFNLTEIMFNTIWVTFKSEDGEKAYSLLQIAKQNNGKIPIPVSNQDSSSSTTGNTLIDELERLSNLKAQGMLTENEFQEAKKRLLGI